MIWTCIAYPSVFLLDIIKCHVWWNLDYLWWHQMQTQSLWGLLYIMAPMLAYLTCLYVILQKISHFIQWEILILFLTRPNFVRLTFTYSMWKAGQQMFLLMRKSFKHFFYNNNKITNKPKTSKKVYKSIKKQK